MRNFKSSYIVLLVVVFGFESRAQQSACLPLASTPSATQNYVISNTIRKDSIKLETQLVNLSNCDLNQTIQYLDGLGRPLQTVQVKASPLGKDIIVPFAYDASGREAVKYEPYADPGTANGSFRAAAIANQLTFYSAGVAPASIQSTSFPFSKTVFEPSPLNRVLENGAPGNIWQPGSARTASAGRTVVTEYAANGVQEVPYIRLTATGGIADSFYPAGKLYKNVTKDENWTSGKVNTTEEFKDFEGRIVMKRAWKSSTVSLMTFYVYDDFGNLRFVIPPFPGAPSVVTLNENDAVSKQYCYVYKYDARNRLIAKRLPGKEWEYFIYNKLDQLVLTQNARQRDEHKWMFTKYDALGRVAVTGIYINSGSPSSLQATVSNQTFLWESWAGDNYTSVAFPQTFNYYQTILKYDNYNFPNPPTYVLTTGVSTRTTGLVTASSNFIDNTASYLTTVNYYDDYGRVIKSFEQHYASSSVLEGNYDEISNAYTFAGELKASTRVHRTGAAATTIAMNYEYDAWGRKVKTREKINADAQVLVSENLYSEIGRVKEKKLHNGLQSTTFTYNQRGWLKSKTSNQFSELLKYEDGTTPQYNGNISNQNWGFAATTPNVFTYTYDALSRLTNAAATNLSEAITYDELGNILTMNRNGTSGTYTYDGNKLTQIIGGLGTQPYVYDLNGNMTTDGRNGVVVTYNMDGLPKGITKTGLSIAYLYDSQGNKLKQTSNVTGTAVTTNYVNGIQYTGSNIDFIQTEEGIARRNGASYSYEYNLSDHLGNARVTFHQYPAVGGPLVILQKDDYFAFGKRSAVQAGTNKYLYNGKELQEGLEMYDYGARFYDPVIGRWNVVDPYIETHFNLTPYNYVLNNPLSYIDPFGLDTLNANNVKPEGWNKFNPKQDVMALSEVVITATKKDNNSNAIAYTDFFMGGTEYKLGKSLDRYNKFDGVRSYEPYRFKDLVRKNPALRTRSVNIELEVPFLNKSLGRFVVPRNVVTGVAKGLKVAGLASAGYGIGMSANDYFNNRISGTHLTTNLIMTGVGFVWPIGTIISGGYSIVAEDMIFSEDATKREE
jgi:RHS repeat-associated protein